MTQTELAEASGISLRTIQRLEKGEVEASINSLNQLEKVLSVSLRKNPNKPKENVYNVTLTLTLFDMKQLVEDLKVLFKRNWKWIIGLLVFFWLASNYPEIKAGFWDGWLGK